MSANVESSSQNSVMTMKLELAKCLVGNSKAPKQALESIFKGAMWGIEKAIGKTFDLSLKQRVWEKVSPDHLKILKQTLLQTFCEKILGEVSEKDTKKMLKEHIEKGIIQNPIYIDFLSVPFYLEKEVVTNVVCGKTESLKGGWIPQIVKAVEEEGIQLQLRCRQKVGQKIERNKQFSVLDFSLCVFL